MGKLLILDDEIAIARTIATIAEMAGLEARITTNPAEFFHSLDDWQPTHIALDLVMPEMDGVQVMVNLAERGCRARVIITSGVGSRVLDAAGRSAAEHGLYIAGMLAKPFSAAALRALLLDPGARLDSGAGTGRRQQTAHRGVDLGPEHLRRALDGRQLYLAYQPQIACDTGAVTGFEALVRWHHPEAGTIMPDRFIPMAESTGLIDELTDQVLELGLAWLSEVFPSRSGETSGGAERDEDVTLSINMPAGTLGDRDFVEHALQACRRHGIDQSRVILELTETSAMRDPVASLDQLTRMRMKGFQLSIDDFGTGFSSMLQLARLPFSELKVDRSFVMTAMQSMESRAVVRSILDLGKSLGLRTVAEGVEDGATLEFLKGIGCDVAQGYFIARPMPGDAVPGWMSARKAPARGEERVAPAANPPDPVESFHWDENFVTGLPEVDRQHQRLVELINRLSGTLLGDAAISQAEVNSLFAELLGYGAHHFREEEVMMAALSIDPRHVEFHRKEHAGFLAEVVQMRETAHADKPESLQPVLSFLVHWLAYHMLGVDKGMARQATAISEGSTPEAAFHAEMERVEGSTKPLVKALRELLRVVSRRNHELRETIRLLESRNMERTAALNGANQQLARIAMTDALTGIPNRRHAMTMLSRSWDEARASGRPLACLMIDADNLKPVNDRHGHDVGDELLRGLASRLRDAARNDDIVCRLGGDEFFVIAPATPFAGALQLAEKFRLAIAQLRVPTGGGEWQASVSIGIAVRDATMDHPDDLLKAADQAVYTAKRAGRNVVATPQGAVLRPATE